LHIPQQRKVIFTISLTRRIEKHYFLIYLRKSRNSSIKIGNRVPRISHTCASFLHANGVPLVTIQEIMGHAQLTTTISYLHELENAKSLALSQMHAQILDEGGNES